MARPKKKKPEEPQKTNLEEQNTQEEGALEWQDAAEPDQQLKPMDTDAPKVAPKSEVLTYQSNVTAQKSGDVYNILTPAAFTLAASAFDKLFNLVKLKAEATPENAKQYKYTFHVTNIDKVPDHCKRTGTNTFCPERTLKAITEDPSLLKRGIPGLMIGENK